MGLGAAEREIRALTTVDPSAMSDAELHAHTTRLHRLQSLLAAATATADSAWDARRAWAEDGSKSAAARLSRECDIDPARASAELRRARKLRHMPVVHEAFLAGRLSADVVDLLTRARTTKNKEHFARDEAMLVARLIGMRFATAKKVIAYWRSTVRDEIGDPLDDRQAAERHGCCDRTFEGGVHVAAFLPRVPGTIVLDEWHRLERELFQEDLAEARRDNPDASLTDLKRTSAQRMADALVLMATRSASADGAVPPRPLFTALIGYETYKGRVCEMEDGTVVEPEELRPYLADAEVERVVFDGPARVIEVGPRTRFFTGGLRRAIQVRDRTCQDPSGCDEPMSRCEVDHKEEFEDGGETTQANGQLNCSFHNKRKHREKRKRQALQRRGMRELERWRRELAAQVLAEPYEPYELDTS